MSALLPEGFADLEPFVADWVLPDSLARMAKRQASSIEHIRRFYDAIIPRAEAVLAHLRNFALGELPPAEERLLKLMLSLAEVGPAVDLLLHPHFRFVQIHPGQARPARDGTESAYLNLSATLSTKSLTLPLPWSISPSRFSSSLSVRSPAASLARPLRSSKLSTMRNLLYLVREVFPFGAVR